MMLRTRLFRRLGALFASHFTGSLLSCGAMGWVLLTTAVDVDAQPPADDLLQPILAGEIEPTVDQLIRVYRQQRRYRDEDFPMAASDFGAFQQEVRDRFLASTGLADWTVDAEAGKHSPLAKKFVDRKLKTIHHHGVEMEVHVLQILDRGLKVPIVICLPDDPRPQPGICVFSGHTKHGLRDLVLDLDSYQSGVAVKLAQAGFVTVAVEKVDTGYLSRDGLSGVDEPPVATFGLYWGRPTRAHQLMACLAASEVLAGHPRVDESRLGATGVSLGGWLSVQTAMLSNRIAAVADFGVKTVTVPPQLTPDRFQGMPDLCHILPGMLAVCDRNLMSLAYCPRPLLAAHGRKHTASHTQAFTHYRDLYQRQYEQLGQGDQFEYHVHDGGDTMPAELAIDYFRRRFRKPE